MRTLENLIYNEQGLAGTNDQGLYQKDPFSLENQYSTSYKNRKTVAQQLSLAYWYLRSIYWYLDNIFKVQSIHQKQNCFI